MLSLAPQESVLYPPYVKYLNYPSLCSHSIKSQSPSETLQSSARLGNGYLSPNQSRNSLPLQSIRSAPSNPTFPNSPNGARNELPPAPGSAPRRAPSLRAPTPSNDANGYRFPSSPGPAPPAPQWERAPPAQSVRSNSPRPSSRESFSKSPSYVPQPLPRDHFPGVWEAGSRSDVSFGQLRNGYNEMAPSMSQQNLSAENGEHSLNRVASNTSMRSAKSKHSHYDPTTYLDPAYFSVAAPSTSQARRVASPGPPRSHSRAASTSSALSYITDLQRR